MNAVLELLDRPVLEVAPLLLGWRVRTEVDGEVTEIELTEVEAYAGAADPASHAYRGPTRRNRSMFEGAGTLYVYRSYGVHWCVNIVTGPPGSGEAVLLRGGVPTQGADVMIRRRGAPRLWRSGQATCAAPWRSMPGTTAPASSAARFSSRRVPLRPGCSPPLGSGSLSPPTNLGGSSPQHRVPEVSGRPRCLPRET